MEEELLYDRRFHHRCPPAMFYGQIRPGPELLKLSIHAGAATLRGRDLIAFLEAPASRSFPVPRALYVPPCQPLGCLMGLIEG